MSIKREDVDAGRIDFSDMAAPKAKRRIPPTHPGKLLRAEFLDPLGITPYRLAKDTGVPQTRISAILSGDRAITADTALRFGRFFNMSARFWLGLQEQYDLDRTRDQLGKRLEAEVTPLAIAK
jgi:antitoxin HigA-1